MESNTELSASPCRGMSFPFRGFFVGPQRIYTSLDIVTTFWQVPSTKSSSPLAAFSAPDDLREHVKRAIQLFGWYFYESWMIVRTDNTAVEHVLKNAKSSRLLRPQEWDYTVVHRTGSSNGNTDARYPLVDTCPYVSDRSNACTTTGLRS